MPVQLAWHDPVPILTITYNGTLTTEALRVHYYPSVDAALDAVEKLLAS